MPRVCLVVIAGLDRKMLAMIGPRLGALQYQASLEPVFPALTSTFQASLTTGKSPAQHGIICNGLFTRALPDLHPVLDGDSYPEFRKNVSFWEQSDALLQAPRFWQNAGIKTALLFFQQSIGTSADIILTPKPVHTPDGRTVSSCWARPGDLYEQLAAELGPFPLHHYWGPVAGIAASEWIGKAAAHVWQKHQPDLQMVYIPHLDYNLQRLGPADPAIARDVKALDQILEPLIAAVWKSEGKLMIVGDYAMNTVSRAVAPNLLLRQAGLLKTTPDENGKLLVDYAASGAFVMVDHQVAFLYCRPDKKMQAFEVLRPAAGVDRILEQTDFAALGIANTRAGDGVLLSAPDAWFIHDWWQADGEKPNWQFSVDIHRKPGYDPRELFFDPAKPGRAIAQDPAMVRGSHGLVSADPNTFPALLSDGFILPRPLSMAELSKLLLRWVKNG